ncbi:MAG: trypsin-like serine protease [Bryobacter sp.]|nr:trypsin-like serine protease [Bryobacter sp.]
MRNAILQFLLLGGAFFVSPAQAIIIQDETAYASYYNVTSSEFNGIARLMLSGNSSCTAFAINAFQVLTAAHCIPTANTSLAALTLDGVQFSLYSEEVFVPSAVFISPDWVENDFGGGNDIAVLYFANGLPEVNHYPLLPSALAGTELGSNFELFGYGRCGTPTGGFGGALGACDTPGLHRAANRYDSIAPNDKVLEYSFDSYSPNTILVGSANCRENDALCILNQSEFSSKADEPTIGTRQGIATPGDSGGPSLILYEGRYYSVGIHSFIACLSLGGGDPCLSPPDWDASFGPNGTFGEFAGDTRIGSQTDFISASVPEPSSFVLAGAALFLIWRKRLVQRKSSVLRSRGLDGAHDGESAQTHWQT